MFARSSEVGMAEYEIEYVTLSGGAHVSADKLVCPRCRTLDLGTDIDTSSEPFKATCPKGHEWTFSAKADA